MIVSSNKQQDPAPSRQTTSGMIDKAQLDEAGKALSMLKPLGKHVAKAMQSIDPTAKYVQNSYELWEPMLDKVQCFASLVEKIGDVCRSSRI